MNTLSSINIESPINELEDCAHFKIDSVASPFRMRNVTKVGQTYTLSFWVRSDTSEGTDAIRFSNTALFSSDISDIDGWVRAVQPTSEWERRSISFIADGTDLYWRFPIGEYYVYHAQLEVGHKATDWRPNPDDVDSAIGDTNETAHDAKDSAESALDQLAETQAQLKVLGDRVSSIVRNGNGGTLYQQDADGFYYIDSTYIENHIPSGVADELDKLDGLVINQAGSIDILRSDADALKELAAYIETNPRVDQGGPYIELGDPASPFKVRITNEQIEFKEDSVTPAYINNQKLMIETAEVKTELQFGDSDETNTTGVWVWKQRTNGNLGLVWKDGE